MVGDRDAAVSSGKPIVNLLLVEDNLAEARFLQEVLKGSIFSRFDLAHAQRLQEAIALLAPPANRFDVILLDLTLPDSHGLASLDLLIQHASSLPIVVLTNTNDEDLAVEAVRHGAQDYLVKRQINQDSLVRSLRYAIERKQTAEALREANEILELRVQERTAELAEANARLKQEVDRRQRTQKRLELAQQAGKIGSFEWHLQSNTLTWTAELEALYGVAPGGFDHRYDRWSQTLHPDDRPKIEQEMQQAIEARQGLDTEFRVILPTRAIRWIAVKSSLFCDDTGAPLRLIGIHMDITEKKQLEAQFLRAQRLESLGTLASGIAHDLNNILTPILTIVQLLPLKLHNLDPPTQLLLSTAETSALRGADLVKQILSFARGVEGKRVYLQLQHLLQEIEKIVRQTLPKSIAIRVDLPHALWAIAGDATQLHQVFLNLCVNARDAMPAGGTLTITAANLLVDEQTARAHLDAAVGAYVRVTIADSGTGMTPDVLQRIFDPFFTTKEIGKGTGLGLSAVLGIVKSHGGFIDVQSALGQGSQFQVFLPACQSIALMIEDELEPLSGRQELILVVDDEAAIRESTQNTLETYNYRVLTACNGVEAIALLNQHKSTIRTVLMDIMMPTLDGFATLPLLHRLEPTLPVVAMSGLNSIEAVAQAEQLGFQGFLSKPFTAKELLHVLAQSGLAL